MKAIFGKYITLFLLPLLCAALSSCGFNQAISSNEPTPFLTSTGVDTTKKSSRIPFSHSWSDPNIQMMEDYENIIIRPVTTKYLRTANWERSKSDEIPTQKAFKKRADKLAQHFTEQLNIAFSDPICIFYKINDPKKPKTLILEVALTDAHFPAATSSLAEIPVCEFEARVTDAKTGKLIATVADRRGPDLHIRGESKTHITDNDEICAIWARQLMEASNKEIFAHVRRKLITVE